MIIANYSIAICSLAFFLFLVGVYFSKKNMDNLENKIYRQLLFWNFFVIFIQLVMLILSKEFHYHPFLTQIMNALLYIACNCWYFFICFYIVLICNENSKLYDLLSSKKSLMFITIFLLLISFIQLLLPTNIIEEDNVFVAIGVGPSYIFSNVFDAILVDLAIISYFINRKTANKKKTFPFKILVLFGIIIEVVSLYYPVTLIPLFATLTSYLMYHTIENPDVLLISELTLAKSEAEKSSRAKSDFLSSMSHELRTPLNAILGLSQVITDSNDVDDMHNDSKDITIASEKLLSLVDEILDINKLDANEVQINNIKYNPYNEFKELYDKMLNRVADKNIDFSFNFSSDLPTTLYGDIEKIQTIVSNLISNAIKYTDNGSVKFVVDCLNNKDKCNLIITVSDTGVGIKEEEISKLFDRFYRRNEDMDSNIEGAGLGLAVSKSLIELLDGKITVNSTYNEGSTFIINVSQIIDND